MEKEKKTVEICVKVTPTEKKELQKKADAAHLSLSRYLVKSASDKKIMQTENILDLIFQIKKIGTNINQIAYIANSQRFMTKNDMAAVRKQMEAVLVLMKKVINATYDEKEGSIKSLERKIDKLMERVDVNGNG